MPTARPVLGKMVRMPRSSCTERPFFFFCCFSAMGSPPFVILLCADKVPHGVFDKIQHSGIIHADSQKSEAQRCCCRKKESELHQGHNGQQRRNAEECKNPAGPKATDWPWLSGFAGTDIVSYWLLLLFTRGSCNAAGQVDCGCRGMDNAHHVDMHRAVKPELLPQCGAPHWPPMTPSPNSILPGKVRSPKNSRLVCMNAVRHSSCDLFHPLVETVLIAPWYTEHIQ